MELALVINIPWMELSGDISGTVKLKKPLSKCDDKELLSFVGQGNAEAFSIFYLRYAATVLGFVRRMMGGDQAAAEDIAQLAWEKVIRHASNYEGKSFEGWLFTIARNTALDELRMKGRWRAEEFDETDESHGHISDSVRFDTAEDLLIRFSEHRELERRIDRLPDRQRIVLVAWMQYDGGQKELAAQMGMTLKSLEMLLIRAKKGLESTS